MPVSTFVPLTHPPMFCHFVLTLMAVTKKPPSLLGCEAGWVSDIFWLLDPASPFVVRTFPPTQFSGEVAPKCVPCVLSQRAARFKSCLQFLNASLLSSMLKPISTRCSTSVSEEEVNIRHDGLNGMLSMQFQKTTTKPNFSCNQGKRHKLAQKKSHANNTIIRGKKLAPYYIIDLICIHACTYTHVKTAAN